MKAIEKDTLKQILAVYTKLDQHAYNLTDYEGSAVLEDALDGLRNLLVDQNVMSIDADCDGLIVSVNPDYE